MRTLKYLPPHKHPPRERGSVSSNEQGIHSSKLRDALTSRDRRVVLRVFRKRPNDWLSQAEVSSTAKLPLSQVSGVLRGFRGRYNPDLSLLTLGLIEEKQIQISTRRKQKLYKFNVKSQLILDLIDDILKRHEFEGEP